MKHLIKLAFLLLALLLPATAAAHDFEVDGIYYNILNNNEVEVAGTGEEYSSSVTIPSSVTYNDTTYSVTRIGEYAFRDHSRLTSINIPNSVTSIGYEAFYCCSGLTSINIPNSVTSIGDCAFQATPWYDNQPDGLVYAGLVVYSYKGTMPEGTSITLHEGTKGIGDCAFAGINGLKSVNMPNSVMSIGYEAFGFCSNLTNISIPNSVLSIGQAAFWDCSALTSIIIPNSVISIGNYAFANCSALKSISVASENTTFDSRDNCNAIIETASNTLIAGCKNTIIPNSVTSIGTSAFWGCNGLMSIIIPNTVTSIDNDAFVNCI
jgi:hypothetical protein